LIEGRDENRDERGSVRGKVAVKGLLYGSVSAALALAVAYTFTPSGWLKGRVKYTAAGFDFTGGHNGGESPRIVVVSVSSEIIRLNGIEVFRPPADTDGRNIIFEDLKNEIESFEKAAGENPGFFPGPDPKRNPIIIHCDGDVRFSLLIRVLCTFWAVDYEQVFLATPPVEENRIEVLPVFRPSKTEWVIDAWFPDYINVPIEVLEKVPFVFLSDKGFYVGIQGGISDLVPLERGQFDTRVLKVILSLMTYDDEYVQIVSEPDILFGDVIEIMAVCSELGLNKIALTEHSMDLDKLCRGGSGFQYSYSRSTSAGLE
jgi:biopolymer transport protein ExbD